jgi:hypothetical protein
MIMRIVASAVFLMVLILSGICQDNKTKDSKCDIESITQLKINKDSITDIMILRFVKSVGKDCINNAEFSEASNCTLFWLADIKTKDFIRLLNDNKNNIEIDFIVKEFESPINDGIDLISIYNKIKQLNDKTEISLRLLKSIETASKKSGLMIK